MRLKITYFGKQKLNLPSDNRIKITIDDKTMAKIKELVTHLTTDKSAAICVPNEIANISDSPYSTQCRISIDHEVLYTNFEFFFDDGSVATTEIVPYATLTAYTDKIDIYPQSIYTSDGRAGLAAVCVKNGETIAATSRPYCNTTADRIAIMSVIQGLKLVPFGERTVVYSDDTRIAKLISRRSDINTNLDLIKKLNCEINARTVSFVFTSPETINPFKKKANKMATKAAKYRHTFGVFKDEYKV